MDFCEIGIVINSRPLQENNRIVTIFTQGRGKFETNFKGVRLAKAKLRSLSMTVSSGDYRLFLKKGSNFPVCTGGKSISVYPGIRSNLKSLGMAFHFCELVNRLTPPWQPAENKFFLLYDALADLENNGVSPWMRHAFTLRLLDYAGFGFRDTATGLDSNLWDALHDAAPDVLRNIPFDPYAADYADGLVSRALGNIGIRLMTLPFVKV